MREEEDMEGRERKRKGEREREKRFPVGIPSFWWVYPDSGESTPKILQRYNGVGIKNQLGTILKFLRPNRDEKKKKKNQIGT